MNSFSIIESALYVNNLEIAEKFYTNILGLKIIRKFPGRHVFFECNETVLLIFNPEETRKDWGEVPVHGSIGQWHIAFWCGSKWELEKQKNTLQSRGIVIEKEVQRTDGTSSFYFRDPSGNSLEFIETKHWFQLPTS